MIRGLIPALLSIVLAGTSFGQGTQPDSAAPKGPDAIVKDGLNDKFGPGTVDTVARERGQLRIRTNLPMINDEGYRKVIVETCGLMLSHSNLYKDVKEIVVMNRPEKQGYVYKTPGKCQSLVEATDEDANDLLFQDTKFCGRGCN